MNQASLYQRANEVQRRDAKQILSEYASMIQWRYDGNDSLLDVGTGSGDVLMDFIYPLMPRQFKRLVGTDVSRKMVDFARKNYLNYDNCEFYTLDIGSEELLPKNFHGQFDHVTSFYCLHWVQNQRSALRNIYNLLRPEGGDCLLVFVVSNPIFDIYLRMSRIKRWSVFMRDVNDFISPLHSSTNPQEEFHSILREAGFTDCHVEVQHRSYIYKNIDIIKDNIKAVCPFVERLPKHLLTEFWTDWFEIMKELKIKCEPAKSGQKETTVCYKLLIAYAKKSFKNPYHVNKSLYDDDRKYRKGIQ